MPRNPGSSGFVKSWSVEVECIILLVIWICLRQFEHRKILGLRQLRQDIGNRAFRTALRQILSKEDSWLNKGIFICRRQLQYFFRAC